MKKSSLLAVTLTPLLAASGLVYAQDPVSVATDPVGFVRLDLQPGLQAVGVSMVNPAVASGRVASNTASAIVMENDISGVSGDSLYVEVVSGPGDALFVGERFDVESVSESTVNIAASSNNTISLDGIDLAGYSVVVRPHVTLGQIFPPDMLNAGDASTGDQVLFFDPETLGFSTITLEEGIDFLGIPDQWAEGGQPRDGKVIPPGQGFFFNLRGDAIQLTTVIGEVRMNNFRQPLVAGLNLVSEGHPLDNSPSSRFMDEDNGFVAGDAQTGDAILIFDPETLGFSTIPYIEGVDFLGIPSQWQDGGVVKDDEPLFSASGAVFIRKGVADPNYEAPRTFMLD